MSRVKTGRRSKRWVKTITHSIGTIKSCLMGKLPLLLVLGWWKQGLDHQIALTPCLITSLETRWWLAIYSWSPTKCWLRWKQTRCGSRGQCVLLTKCVMLLWGSVLVSSNSGRLFAMGWRCLPTKWMAWEILNSTMTPTFHLFLVSLTWVLWQYKIQSTNKHEGSSFPVRTSTSTRMVLSVASVVRIRVLAISGRWLSSRRSSHRNLIRRSEVVCPVFSSLPIMISCMSPSVSTTLPW